MNIVLVTLVVVSFMVVTENQDETDRYWNAITTTGGEESMCGWPRSSARSQHQ
jgi:predicted 3-demethylubiquinone-9 3-methyltransferase (glyoxalase superfamily)